ncbi:MAG: hypothetical protein RR632_03720 [Christensenella sp.]
MKKATEVLGLRVMGVKEGLEDGTAQDFMIDVNTKSVEYMILKSDNGYEFRALKLSDVMGVGTDYIMTASIENAVKMYESRDILQQIEKGFFMLGTTALSSTGDIMGKVLDFDFDETSGKIHLLYLDNDMQFEMDKVATLAGRMVFIDPNGDNMERITGSAQKNVEETPISTYENAVDGESRLFLLGKTTKTDVVSDNGVFHVPAGITLTEEILNVAAANDALLSLTLSV